MNANGEDSKQTVYKNYRRIRDLTGAPIRRVKNAREELTAVDILDLLRSKARQLHRIAEQECNGIERWERIPDGRGGTRTALLASWTEEDQANADKKSAEILSNAERLAAMLGARVGTQGDPRGAVLWLEFDPRPGSPGEHGGPRNLYLL